MYFTEATQGFAQISADSLKTLEQKHAYFAFLSDNHQISAVNKLFGTAVSSDRTNTEIEKQAKKLITSCHPDKAVEDQKEFYDSLFKLIKQVEFEAKTKKQAEGNVWGIDKHLFLRNHMQDEKWQHALDEWSNLSSNRLLGEANFELLGALIYVNLGDLKKAQELLPQSASNVKEAWQECSNGLEILRVTPSTNAINQMILLLDSMSSIGQEISKKLGFSVRIIPYTAPLAVAECLAKLSGQPLDYEKYLREAIRYCPSALKDIKDQLIVNLKTHVQKHHLINNEVRDPNDDILNKQKLYYSEITNVLNGYRLHTASQCINSENLSSAIEEIENNLKPTNELLSGLVNWGLNLFLGGMTSPEQDAQRKAELELCLNVLKGFEAYNNGVHHKAKHYFTLSKEPFMVALVQFASREYAQALTTFKQVSKNDLQDAWYYLYTIINYCDYFYYPESSTFNWMRLDAVDSFQLTILQSFYQSDLPPIEEWKSQE